MECPECGGSVEGDSEFCRHCGAALVYQESAARDEEFVNSTGDIFYPGGPFEEARRYLSYLMGALFVLAVASILLLGAEGIGIAIALGTGIPLLLGLFILLWILDIVLNQKEQSR